MKISLVILFFLLPLNASAAENLIITEVKVRGVSPDNSFIRIHNPTGREIDVSGFRLRKKSSTGREYSLRVFPSGSSISSGGYFLWANSRGNYHLEADSDVYSTASIASNNSVALVSPEGKIIDALAWGEGENQFKKGDPFPQNPSEDQTIKRREENGSYRNTGNNSRDFYLFPQKEIPVAGGETKTTPLEKDSQFPLVKGLSLSITLAFLLLYFKKITQETIKYVRT